MTSRRGSLSIKLISIAAIALCCAWMVREHRRRTRPISLVNYIIEEPLFGYIQRTYGDEGPRRSILMDAGGDPSLKIRYRCKDGASFEDLRARIDRFELPPGVSWELVLEKTAWTFSRNGKSVRQELDARDR